MQEQPSSPETTKAGTPQNETLDERLMRLSREGHPSGEKFVTGTNLGPFTIFSIPSFGTGKNEEPQTE
jgi:hypothetical protein